MGTKITALPTDAVPEGADLIPFVDVSVNRTESTTIDNLGGSLAASGVLDARYREFDVRSFGAVGDGTTDNAAAINATIDAAIAAGGGVVTFPAGDFAYTGLLHFRRSKVSMQGAGTDATILRPQTADSLILIANTTDPSGPGDHGGFIRDFRVEAVTANCGIQVGVRVDFDATNVKVNGALQVGWRIWGTQNSSFSNCMSTNSAGIGLDLNWSAATNDFYSWYSTDHGVCHVRIGPDLYTGPVMESALGTSNNTFYSLFCERSSPTAVANIWHNGYSTLTTFHGARLFGAPDTTPDPPYALIKVDAIPVNMGFYNCRFRGKGASVDSRILRQTVGQAIMFADCNIDDFVAPTGDLFLTPPSTPAEVRSLRADSAISQTLKIRDRELRAVECGGLYLDGTASNGPSTPHDASLSTTDLTLMAWVLCDDYTIGTVRSVFAKWDASGQRSWGLRIQTNGAISLQWSTNGTSGSVFPSFTAGLQDGAGYWIAATLDVDNGAGGYTCRAWKATLPPTRIPQPHQWSQCGSDSVGGAPTTIFPSTSSVWVGGMALGTFEPMIGTVARAVVCSDVATGGLPGSTIVADWRGDTPMASKYRDITGKIWTTNGTAWAWTNT